MLKKFMIFLLGAVAACNAAEYVQVYTFDELAGDLNPSHLYAVVSDSQAVYSQFYGGSSYESGITKVDAYGVSTVLVSPTQWLMASGKTSISGIYNFSEYGDYLYIAEINSDQAYKIHKDSGAITVLASQADLFDLVGNSVSKINLISPGVADSSGYYFNERETDNIFLANDAGVNIAVTRQQVLDVTGGTDLSGGMASDNAGRLFMYGSNGICQWDTNTSEGICLLSEGDILGLTENTAVSMRDLYFAPDGKLYFYDNNYGIMSLSPDDMGSLSTVMTKAELLAGPAATSNIYGFSWYNNDLAFSVMNSGYYAMVPEPGSMSIAALATLAFIRRRVKKTRC